MRSALSSLPPSIRRKVLFKASPSNVPAGATFTRSTVGTYLDVNNVLQTAGINVLRNAHYINGVPGILLEGAATNKIIQNGDLTNAAWTVSNVTTALDGATLAPDGTSSTKITAGAAGARVLLTTAPMTEVANTLITFSTVLKQGTARFGALNIVGAGTGFFATADLQTGTVTNSGISGTGTLSGSGVINLGNGWFRVWVAGTLSVTTYNVEILIVGASSSGYQATDAVNGQTINAALPQYELSAFPTSIIKTTTVAVTRTVDALSFPATFSEQPLTIYAKWIDQGSQALAAGSLGLGDFSVKPSIVVYHGTTTGVDAAFHNGTAQQNAGTIASGIVFGDTVEARLTLTATGIIQRGHARNGGAETLSTATAGQAFGTGWGGSILLVNKYQSIGTDGFAAFVAIKIAPGIRTLAEMQNL